MHFRVLTVFTAFVMGCSGEDNSGFSSGGSYSVNDYLSETDTGSSDTEDTEETVPEGTPDIDSFAVTLDDTFPSYPLVFALEVSYTDTDDNVEDGYLWCQFEVDGGSSQYCATQTSTGETISNGMLPIDGTESYITNKTVYAYFDASDYDEDQSFYFEVSLTDAEGNTSATAGVFAE